jgi:hypothetical protein
MFFLAGYTVNADCSGTYTLNIKGLAPPMIAQMVVSNCGTELRGNMISPQSTMTTATGQKM